MKPIKLIFFSIALTFAVSCVKCTPPQAKTVIDLIELANSFFNFIHNIVTKSEDFKFAVQEISDTVNRSVSEKRDIKEIAIFWEKYWEDIHKKYNGLVSSLEEMEVQSNEYFTALSVNNSSIKDPELKKQDQAKNEQIRIKWEAEYKNAVSSVAQAKILLDKGDDFLLILRNSVLREEVEKQLPILSSITNQANLMSSQIKLFEIRAKTIFNYAN